MPRGYIISHGDALDVEIRGRRSTDVEKTRVVSTRSGSSHAPVIQAIVKVGYMRASRVSGYAKYIERDGTAGKAQHSVNATQGYSTYMGRDGAGEDGHRAELFTRIGSEVNQNAFIERSVKDPRAWTLIVSPGTNDLDMERYVREVVMQMELDLGRPLDYLAAIHRNTPFTHAHILMRGKDRGGLAFKMPPDYIRHGIRRRATEIAQLYRERGWVVSHEKPVDLVAALGGLQQSLQQWMRQHAREGYSR